MEIKNFAPDDPIPDLFGNYKPGHVITRPDGRKFKRGLFGQWERVTDEDTLDGRTGGA